MGLDKKLIIYGIHEPLVDSEGQVHASDYYCHLHLVEKKKVQAQKFFPEDSNESMPYCLDCYDFLKSRSILLK